MRSNIAEAAVNVATVALANKWHELRGHCSLTIKRINMTTRPCDRLPSVAKHRVASRLDGCEGTPNDVMAR